MATIALYTVITGGYDTIPPMSPAVTAGADCFLITDDPKLEIPPQYAWKKIVVPKEEDPHRHQRRLKIRWFDVKELAGYDTVVYMDANIHLNHALKHILALHTKDISLTLHPKRKCVYEEGKACQQLSKAPTALIEKQMAAYRKEGIPENLGMYQTGIMFRNNTPEVKDFCVKWHKELTKHTHRDQLAIMPVIHRTGIAVKAIPYQSFIAFAKIVPHKNMHKYADIHYLTPYAVDGNIGRAYNEACRRIEGRDDWIVIRDGDTSFTTPDWGRQIEEVLRTHGDKYQVYGAMTNRIRSPHQRVPDMFDEMDLRKHWEAGRNLEQDHWAEVGDGGTGVAGFFMAFRRSTWEKSPFRERDRTFDTLFCREVARKGGKIGIMKGVYLVHLYRIWSKNPFDDVKHLEVVSR